MVKIVSFAGTLSNACKHRNTTMLHGNIIHHLHHDNSFANSSTAKESHLAAPWKRNKKVYNLNTCFKNLNRCILLGKFWSRSMNRTHFFLTYRAEPVNGFAHNIKHTAKASLTNRHHNGLSGIFNIHTPDKTVCYIHCYASNNIITKMLRYFNNKVIRFITNSWIRNQNSCKNIRQFPLFKLHINNRSHNLSNFT